jgi:hypothetical protein
MSQCWSEFAEIFLYQHNGKAYIAGQSKSTVRDAVVSVGSSSVPEQIFPLERIPCTSLAIKAPATEFLARGLGLDVSRMDVWVMVPPDDRAMARTEP